MLTLRLLAPLLRRWAAEGLGGELPEATARTILNDVVNSTLRTSGAGPGRAGAGYSERLMVTLAEMTARLYEALQERGFNEEVSRRLTASAAWSLYRRMAWLPGGIARWSARDPESRLRRATGLFRRFPFGPPAYRMKDRAAPPGTVAFDVLRCPVAEYFRARGMVDLCRETWCELDAPLARLWGARLERTKTLVEGADRCDFRWVADCGTDGR